MWRWCALFFLVSWQQVMLHTEVFCTQPVHPHAQDTRQCNKTHFLIGYRSSCIKWHLICLRCYCLQSVTCAVGCRHTVSVSLSLSLSLTVCLASRQNSHWYNIEINKKEKKNRQNLRMSAGRCEMQIMRGRNRHPDMPNYWRPVPLQLRELCSATSSVLLRSLEERGRLQK